MLKTLARYQKKAVLSNFLSTALVHRIKRKTKTYRWVLAGYSLIAIFFCNLLVVFFGAILAREGFEILYAQDGSEAREMARRLQPDLILLDINMPIMDGWETAKRLKQEPGSVTVNIPIAFLTSEDLDIETQKVAKELGVIDYFQKGVDKEEFIKRIKKILAVPQKLETQ